jgi:hypothetical protein
VNSAAGDWLLLLHQLPPKPDYLRVKIWRRLQALGAIAVRNSAYALPSNERTREDFLWLQKEIEGLGGEASVCSAQFLGEAADAHIRALFNAARDSDYSSLSSELRDALLLSDGVTEAADERRQRSRKLRKRFDQIAVLDFFRAEGRSTCEALMKQLEEHLRGSSGGQRKQAERSGFNSRTWVTRRHVGVDRMASAWLIQAFIDPAARFVFIKPGTEPRAGEVRFDMADADFTHVGDRCTFEVLLDHFDLADEALQALGRIVHDLDLKDSKFNEDETAGVAVALAGIEAMFPEDEKRLRTSSTLLDALYRALSDRTSAN